MYVCIYILKLPSGKILQTLATSENLCCYELFSIKSIIAFPIVLNIICKLLFYVPRFISFSSAVSYQTHTSTVACSVMLSRVAVIFFFFWLYTLSLMGTFCEE